MSAILLAVCGQTPQVLTETLFALHQQNRPVRAIRVVTTNAGKAACNAHLFDPRTGQFQRFLADFEIPSGSIDFGPQHVLAVKDSHGRVIEDIATEDDNECVLKACMESAFAATSKPGSRVFFSIAGGRKTMGACLALAAQFYGRPQDRLFHVLVSPEFENCPEFFYPPPRSRQVTLRDRQGQPFFKETRYAHVTLVHLPFVSVRGQLAQGMLDAPESPAALLTSLVREERPRLVVDLEEQKILWKDMELDMTPARLALYAFFAQAKKQCACEKQPCGHCTDCFLSQQELRKRQQELSEIYAARTRPARTYDQMSDTGITALSQENFNSYRTKINQALEKTFGAYDAPTLAITADGPHGARRYGLLLDKTAIQLRW